MTGNLAILLPIFVCFCLCYDNFAVFDTFWGQGSPSTFMVTHLVIWDWTTLLTSVNFPHSMTTASPSIMSARSDVPCYCWRQVGRPNMVHTKLDRYYSGLFFITAPYWMAGHLHHMWTKFTCINFQFHSSTLLLKVIYDRRSTPLCCQQWSAKLLVS